MFSLKHKKKCQRIILIYRLESHAYFSSQSSSVCLFVSMFLRSVSILAICRQQIRLSAKRLIFDSMPTVTLIVYMGNGKLFKITQGPFEKIIANILQITLTYLVYEFSKRSKQPLENMTNS